MKKVLNCIFFIWTTIHLNTSLSANQERYYDLGRPEKGQVVSEGHLKKQSLCRGQLQNKAKLLTLFILMSSNYTATFTLAEATRVDGVEPYYDVFYEPKYPEVIETEDEGRAKGWCTEYFIFFQHALYWGPGLHMIYTDRTIGGPIFESSSGMLFVPMILAASFVAGQLIVMPSEFICS